eukprot:5886609-Pyramimonas_sp.AAC.1
MNAYIGFWRELDIFWIQLATGNLHAEGGGRSGRTMCAARCPVPNVLGVEEFREQDSREPGCPPLCRQDGRD